MNPDELDRIAKLHDGKVWTWWIEADEDGVGVASVSDDISVGPQDKEVVIFREYEDRTDEDRDLMNNIVEIHNALPRMIKAIRDLAEQRNTLLMRLSEMTARGDMYRDESLRYASELAAAWLSWPGDHGYLTADQDTLARYRMDASFKAMRYPVDPVETPYDRLKLRYILITTSISLALDNPMYTIRTAPTDIMKATMDESIRLFNDEEFTDEEFEIARQRLRWNSL